MKKARNLWRDLPQGGSRYGSVLTRLFLLLCLLATTQAGWADDYTETYTNPAAGSSAPAGANGLGCFTTIGSTTGNVSFGNSALQIGTNGGSGTFKISTTDGSYLKEITFTETDDDYVANTLTSDDGETARSGKVWTFTPSTQTITSATFSMSAPSGKKTRLAPIEVKVTSNYEYFTKNFSVSSSTVSCTKSNASSDITLTTAGSTDSYNNLQIGNNSSSKTLTITSAGHNIKSIHFTYKTHGNATLSASTGTYSSNSWTAEEDTKTVTFTASSTTYIVGISVELEATSSVTAPTFSPVSGATVSGSQTITINGPSGSTIYYAWATSAQDAAAIYNSGSGSRGTADAGTATTIVESGKTLYAIARKNDTNSTVASASYTVDTTAPTLSSSTPADGATGVATSGTIVLTFNEAIASVDATKFSLDSGTKGTVAIDGSDNTKVNITYSGMENNTPITLSTAAGAVTDAVGNTSAALSNITFTTVAAAIEPTATFNNGSYTIGGTALDLSTLWTSNSSGAVTYTVTNANGTGATISGTSFTATTAGTATVQASQAADGGYSATTKTATITVSAAGAKMITYNLNTGKSANTTLKSSVATEDPTNITNIDIDQTNDGANGTGETNRTAKLAIKTGANGADWSGDPTNYELFKFTVANGKQFTPSEIAIKVANVGSSSADDIKYKAVLSDESGHSINGTFVATKQDGTVEDFTFTNSGNVAFVGNVTLKLWAWQIASSNASAFRMGTPLTIDGTISNAPLAAPTFTTQPVGATYTQGDTPTALSVTATGNPTPTYQWYSNDENNTTTPTELTGETNATYTPSTASVGTTYYYCVATNNQGNATSDIIAVTVNAPAATYAITKAAATNGSFTVSKESAAEGETITVNTTPASGYEVDEVTISTGGTVTEATANTTYTFTMPANAVTVTVTFKAAAAATSAMFDFTDTDWDERGSSDGQKTETKSGITFSITGSGQIRTSVGSKTKFSSGSTFTITAEEGKQITSVVFLQDNSSQRFTPGSECTLTTAGSASPYTHTYTLKAPASSISFTTTGGNVNVFGVTVNYTSADSHTITCATGLSNGSISAASSAPEGTVVTITGTPDASYGLGTVTVTEATSGDNVATTGTGNTRTFIMPDENVNVTATFVKLPTISKGAEVNGSFNTSPESYAAAGTTVTVNATPASGYSVGTITVTDGSSNPVTVTDNQFTMPNSNVTVTVTFNKAAVSAGDKWNFTTMSDADKAAYKADDTNWNTSGTDYYGNKFTREQNTATGIISETIQQITNLKFIRTSGNMKANDVRIYLPTSTAEGYLKFNGNGRGLIIDKKELSDGDKVTVDFIGGSDSKGFTITNGSETSITSATRTSKEFTVTSGNQDLQLVVNSGDVKLYKITIGQTVDVKEPSFSKADGEGYDGTSALSVTVTTNETGEGTKTTYWKYATTALDRDALVATGATEGTATITAANVNEQAIVLSAVTKYETGGNTYYSEVVTATYPYTGKYTPSMTGATIQIQQGDRHTIEPEITLSDGSKFNPEEDAQNEGKSSIHDYFDFKYTMTAKTGNATQNITLDENANLNVESTGGVVNTKIGDNKAEVGDRATIHIVATKKSGFPEGTWPFATTGCETDVTIEVIKKVQGAMMKFYWDPEFKNEVSTTPNVEWKMNGTLTEFIGEFSNGRMFYVKPEPGYKVYVAAGVSNSQLTASKVDGISKSGTVYKYPYRKNDPTDAYPDAPIEYNGIPLLVDDFGGADTKTYYIALVTYNSEGKPEGSAVNAKFTIKNDETKRPGNVTFNPSDNGAKRNTAQTVLTQGEDKAYVYGKFSKTATNYNTHTLIQEDGINGGQTNVGVFSTEVDKRKISALQIAKNNEDGYYYMGTQKTNTYEYLFASEISLKSNTYTTNVYKGEGAAETVDVKTLIDKITYYNKDSKKDINIADSIQAHSGEAAPVTIKEIDRVTYTIQYFNGAGGTGVTDGTTLDGSVVTIGKHSGYVVVTATYPGGYKKKVNSRENVTDVSKATYTIYLVNPDEEIPTITPGSRNFIDEQSFIIQAPKTWYTLYMVQKATDSDYNVDPAEYKSDDSRVKMLKAGEYIRLSVSETSKVRAFAFDYDKYKSSNPTETGHDTSHEVTATYTKLAALKAPTLSPYGTSENPHIRTAKSLTVIATTNDPYSGLEVYYTLDGSDPTPTTGEKYNGSEKINISGASTTIKAITYRPETGQISPVTTGVYMYTGSIKQPKFKVKGNYYTSGTIQVEPTDEITIESEDGGAIYYTLDGSTPTTADAVPYTTSFKIVKNTTGKAIAVKDDASSPITTVEFELTTKKDDLWEAVEETTPGGKLDANDRYVAVGNSGNSSTKAVKFLTATFGGMDAAGWNKTSIGEKTQGTPLDGVGKYSISTTRDVWDETDAEVKNNASTVHGKTFALPAKGNFVRFEPERDGDLTIWLLQQGGLHYTDDGDLCNQFIRLRPVYMFDERGNSITANDIKSSARLSDNWNDLDVDESKDYGEGRHGNWVAKNKSQNGVVNKYYDEDQSEAIYNMYKSYLTTGENDISSGDPIKPFAITDATVKEYTGIDGTGYVMPSGGNVKYTFRVKGGKSYYFFGFRTKLAIRGFQFHPSNGQDVETLSKNVTINDNTSDATSGFDENICNVTYNRTFTKDKWAAVTFPFNVSVAQMKKVFGDHVDLIHFDNVSGSKINFKRHWYPMIVAGTPVFIKPSQDMGTSVTFEGVHIEAVTVNAVSGEGGYKMTGSFEPATINEGDYYISGGKLAVRKGNSINTNACRSWLTADSNNGARFDLTTGTADAFAEEAWSVIGNPQPFVASDETVVTYINGVQEDGIINNIFDGPTGIYTINGQLIRKDATSLEGLSKGIYIVNGKKIAVK